MDTPALYMYSDGTLSSLNARARDIGVRPALTLKSDIITGRVDEKESC